MFEPKMIFRKDAERAEELRAFAKENGWSEEELERAVLALRPEVFDCEYIKWS